MQKNKLAIFDLDGTLIDTNEVNYASYFEALKKFGFILNRDLFKKFCIGRTAEYFLPKLINSNDQKLISEIHSYKLKKYKSHLSKSILNNHLLNILISLKPTYNIALVTSASKKNCIDMLSYHGLKNLFDKIVTKNDVDEVKPSPKAFFFVIDHFKVSTSDTLIFEDSPVGISAALATGSTVFTVKKITK